MGLEAVVLPGSEGCVFSDYLSITLILGNVNKLILQALAQDFILEPAALCLFPELLSGRCFFVIAPRLSIEKLACLLKCCEKACLSSVFDSFLTGDHHSHFI